MSQIQGITGILNLFTAYSKDREPLPFPSPTSGTVFPLQSSKVEVFPLLIPNKKGLKSKDLQEISVFSHFSEKIPEGLVGDPHFPTSRTFLAHPGVFQLGKSQAQPGKPGNLTEKIKLKSKSELE